MILDILIADDEKPIREWIAYNIGQAADRFRLVSAAKSGTEALAMIAEKKPHVVISDIVMPGMDGIELLQKTQEISPETRVVLLTNYADFQFAKQAINYNAFDYLLKSELRNMDLIATLEKIRQSFEASLNKRTETNPFEDSSLYSELIKTEGRAGELLAQLGFPVSQNMQYKILAARRDVRVLLSKVNTAVAALPDGFVFSGKGMRFMLIESPHSPDADPLTHAPGVLLDALIAVSSASFGEHAISSALREAERALTYGELNGLGGLVMYRKDDKPPLDRKDIRKEQRHISDLLFSRKIAESMVALERSCCSEFPAVIQAQTPR